ncbi:hypothetical protein U0070_016401 [Myodes glareolus]|uniref:Cytochrome P450 1A n=1 Tax=Myodes glareolus TaxID=447135 RepID=A0AAW0HAU0_MYOGA
MAPLSTLSKQYGDVLKIRIDFTHVVLLSGLDTIWQALVAQQILAQNQASSSSGCLGWGYVSKEVEYLIVKFQKLMAKDGHLDPYRYLLMSVANAICAMCFDQCYDHDNQELLSIVNLNNAFGEVTGFPAHFFPVLHNLPDSSLDTFKDLNKKVYSFMQKLIKEHYRTFEKGHIRDITDSLIEHCQDKKLDENANVQLSEDKVIAVVFDLFGAGFDTVTTAISWSLMYLVTNTRVQRKIQEELGRWWLHSKESVYGDPDKVWAIP